MKHIITIFLISLFFSSNTFVSATELKPNLIAQMQRQEKVNNKNELSKRLTEKARLKQEAKDKALALKNARIAKQNASQITVISPMQPTISTPLVIKHPPELIPLVTKPVVTITTNTNIPIPPNVDIERVRSAWIDWYNSVRKSEGLGMYSYDKRLDVTSYDWNIEFAKGSGQNHHRRSPGDSYYDFNVIDNWFMARGINPKIINRSKHTENVGYGYYSCNSGDCTDKLIKSIESTFNFFMSEKGKSYDAHYRSIVNPYFTKIGLSIIVVPSEQRYYLTVHYITE